MNITPYDFNTDIELDNPDHCSMVAFYDSLPTKDAFRIALAEVQSRMLDLPQAEMEITHKFIKGAYMRTMRVKAGTVVMGGLHADQCINVMPEGDMTVVTEHGVKRVKTGHMEISEAGTKRFAIAHKDTTWVNIIITNLTDPDEIVKKFTADDYADIEGELLCHLE